jgi:hypothetical protein
MDVNTLLDNLTGRELRLVLDAIARRNARVISAQFDKRETITLPSGRNGSLLCAPTGQPTDCLPAVVYAHGLKLHDGTWIGQPDIQDYYTAKSQALIHFAYEVD